MFSSACTRERGSRGEIDGVAPDDRVRRARARASGRAARRAPPGARPRRRRSSSRTAGPPGRARRARAPRSRSRNARGTTASSPGCGPVTWWSMLPSQPKPARIAGSCTRSARSISSPRACRLTADAGAQLAGALPQLGAIRAAGRARAASRRRPARRRRRSPPASAARSSASSSGSTSASSARRDHARDAREREHLGVVAGLGQPAQRRGGLAGAPVGVGAGGGRAEPQRERQPAGPAGDRRGPRARRSRGGSSSASDSRSDSGAELRAPAVTVSQPPSNQPGVGRARGRRSRSPRPPAAREAAACAGSRRARSCARRCRAGPAGARSPTHRCSASSSASGSGARSRASTSNGVQPAARPRRRISRRSTLLPIPPRPVDQQHAAGRVGPNSVSAISSSRVRPTKAAFSRWTIRLASVRIHSHRARRDRPDTHPVLTRTRRPGKLRRTAHSPWKENLPMLRRLGVIFAALAASLAFAASAQAAPTTPGLKPIPYWVCDSSLPISWTPSTPDLFGTIVGYRVDIGDLTTGTSSAKFTSALGTTLTGLVNGHHYVVRVRALQKRFGVYTYSTSAADTFKRLCLQIPDKIISQYVEYNPWPECITLRRPGGRPLRRPGDLPRARATSRSRRSASRASSSTSRAGSSSSAASPRAATSAGARSARASSAGRRTPARSGAAAADRRAGPPTPPTGARCRPSR